MKCNRLTPETGNTIIQEKEESADEENMMDQDTCIHSSINGASKEKSDKSSNKNLPENQHNVQLHFTDLVHMELEESEESEESNAEEVGNHERQHISNEKITEDNEMPTVRKYLEDLLVHQEISQGIPDSTIKLLGDCSRLQEASMQLTKEAKNRNFDVILWGSIAVMVGLLNIYTDVNLKYSWRRSSEIVAKTQGSGKNHMRHICE